ncbi:Type VI secretion system, VipA, VC_A0107 or Hcp2 [Filimonas lacunae]|uniref:Type VI secretion system, VipA, VC_A0107 or Hcp2 n=1 Tax=Filimonas lacunae TaxID=477680 RepID=A0A173MD34_9BACT|nr:type VI secretion system contractile sheath small subunit [Filimonas lacunae]BAV05358.1 hypothetical protein FLA_1365 [Filimonas lacunae]SIT21765.1 Type VI secretion system, VipA, VC_A0107 or Hcp2 [Filimonas lacunae]
MSYPFYAAFRKVRRMLGFVPRAPDEKVVEKEEEKQNISISINNQNTDTMSMFNYGVGGNEVKVDANEAIQDIQENKTLLAAKLTGDDPVTPEIITGLRTVEDVFRYFRPSIEVEHETADGQSRKEEFNFKNLGDFTPQGITQQSTYLKEMSLQQEQYNTIIRQIKTNKVLRALLENAESKEAFIKALKAVATELQSA